MSKEEFYKQIEKINLIIAHGSKTAIDEIYDTVIAPLVVEIEKLKAENEAIRQNCVSHDAHLEIVVQTKKDTAREILQKLQTHVETCDIDISDCKDFDEVLEKVAEVICDFNRRLIGTITKEYGVELKDGKK